MMRILQVASEAFGLVKTGGLADVTAGLTAALHDRGHDVRLLLPAYPGVATAADAQPLFPLGPQLGGGTGRILEGVLPGTDARVWLLDAPALFERAGGPYLGADAIDHPDNHLRFGALCRAAATLCIAGPALGWAPDIVHAHDWQAGLVAAHLALWGGPRPGTVFTIHNLHFQGRFSPAVVQPLGFPATAYETEGLELFGSASFIKGGIYYADRITTVSPTYAREIQEPTGGEGLDGLLRHRTHALRGILNGIDTAVWDPATDAALPEPFAKGDLGPRATGKALLQREVGLTADDRAPLVGCVTRLAWQKGIDLLLAAMPEAVEHGLQFVIVGSGEAELEAALATAASRYPGRVAFLPGHREPLSHRIFGGSDMIAVPSRFEPCGLTQLYALRYGAIPVVRHTGGLADTIDDFAGERGVGFVFEELSAQALVGALVRGAETYRDRRAWQALQRRAMEREHGWDAVAANYEALYGEITPQSEATLPTR